MTQIESDYSESAKKHQTNGNHISGLVWPRKRKARALKESVFSAENKHPPPHRYYFMQLEGEESLQTMRADGKQKVSVAAGEAIWAPSSKLLHGQWQHARHRTQICSTAHTHTRQKKQKQKTLCDQRLIGIYTHGCMWSLHAVLLCTQGATLQQNILTQAPAKWPSSILGMKNIDGAGDTTLESPDV